MASLSAAVVNEAIMLIGDKQPLVTGTAPTFDSSPAGVAAAQLYFPTVQAVGRRFGWDFSRNIATLALTGNAAPFPWSYEYGYPTNGIEVRQLSPSSLADPNNPLPILWEIGNTLVGAIPVPTKVIWSNLANALARISNTPVENLWDPLFRDSVVRLLASALAMAVGGRPDSARDLIQQYAQIEQSAEQRYN